MAYLTAQQQQDMYNWSLLTAMQAMGPFTPSIPLLLLPGCHPTPIPSGGWPQDGQNAQGQNLTPVDTNAAVKTDVEELQTDVDAIKAKLQA